MIFKNINLFDTVIHFNLKSCFYLENKDFLFNEVKKGKGETSDKEKGKNPTRQ